jgi:hypothetical protein
MVGVGTAVTQHDVSVAVDEFDPTLREDLGRTRVLVVLHDGGWIVR